MVPSLSRQGGDGSVGRVCPDKEEMVPLAESVPTRRSWFRVSPDTEVMVPLAESLPTRRRWFRWPSLSRQGGDGSVGRVCPDKEIMVPSLSRQGGDGSVGRVSPDKEVMVPLAESVPTRK